MKRRQERDDEPDFDDDEEWVEWGGQRIWAVDFTSGGAPIGLTEREMRAYERRVNRRAGWARAHRALATVFERAGRDVEIGRVRFLGEGFHRKGYCAEVTLTPDPEDRSGSYVALLPTPDALEWAREQVPREARVLAWLGSLELPFRVPSRAAVVVDDGLPVLVQAWVAGIAPSLRHDGTPGQPPWTLVAELAAAVHAIEPNPDLFAVGATRREHALDELRAFEGLDEPELVAAREWAEAHLPPDEPARLLHGDLLAQNIRVGFGGPPGLIDWAEARLGDPAYDLAIVTRARRRPFGVTDGLARLIDAYERANGAPMPASAVRVHELCLLARWYREARAGAAGHVRPEDLRRSIARLISRQRGSA